MCRVWSLADEKWVSAKGFFFFGQSVTWSDVDWMKKYGLVLVCGGGVECNLFNILSILIDIECNLPLTFPNGDAT